MQRVARKHRFFGMPLAILLLFGLLGPTTSAATARQTDSPAPLDLGAMALAAPDLEDEGLDGFRIRGSQAIETIELARQYAVVLGKDESDLVDQLNRTGLVWSYDSALDRVPEPQDAASVTTERVYSYLSEHRTAEGAQADFDLRRDEPSSSGFEDVQGAPELGSVSELTRFSGRTSDANRLYYNGLDYTFQIDRVVVGIQLIAYAPRERDVEAPRKEEIEGLARRLLDRVARGLQGDVPGLSTLVVRLQYPAISTGTELDAYEVLDGDVLEIRFNV